MYIKIIHKNWRSIINTLKICKKFLIDKNLMKEAQKVILNKRKDLTEVLIHYFQAIVKNPKIIKYNRKNATKKQLHLLEC